MQLVSSVTSSQHKRNYLPNSVFYGLICGSPIQNQTTEHGRVHYIFFLIWHLRD
jgi:hypothetical protein